MLYDILYYEDYDSPPAYRVFDVVEGKSPEDALLQNLDAIIADIREYYSMSPDDFDDERIQENICVTSEDGFMSVDMAKRAKGL